MSQEIMSKFSDYAAEYNAHRRKFIPCFDEFYAMGIDFLRCSQTVPQVLDVGAGTGLYTEFLLQRYTKANVKLIDFSKQMLAEARRRFAGKDNIEFICADYSKDPQSLGLKPQTFDIIISALSIHHLKDVDKRRVYGNLARLLKPNGEFLNADEISGETELLDERFVQIWHDFVCGNTTEQEFTDFLDRTSIDIRTPLSVQLNWLREFGLDVDCVFKHGLFAVMYGLRKN